MFRNFFTSFRSNNPKKDETLFLLEKENNSEGLKKQDKNQKKLFEDLLKRLKKTNKIITQYIEFLSQYEQYLDREKSFSFLITEKEVYHYATYKIIRNYDKLLELARKIDPKEGFLLENLGAESKMILLENFNEFFSLHKRKTTLEEKKESEGKIPKDEVFLLTNEFDEIKLFADLKLNQNLSNLNQDSITSLESSNNSLNKNKSEIKFRKKKS